MLLALGVASILASFPGVSSGGYKLVWADEFSKPGVPNPNDWEFETGFVRNKELQWYQAANASVSGGHLVIEGRREKIPNPNFDASSTDWRKNREFAQYSSACVTTKGKHAWLYGRFEIRARIRAEKGLWPAIWTLGLDKPWPHNGEVDLLEYYHDTILANTAWGNGTWNTVKTPYAEFVAKDVRWTEKFHTWRMDWDPDFLKIYLDGRLLNETDLSKTIDPDGSNPFHAPQYLLLNLAIGSSGGDPSETQFPTKYEVDYVRVYQKPEH